jgi:hypothetical protein
LIIDLLEKNSAGIKTTNRLKKRAYSAITAGFNTQNAIQMKREKQRVEFAGFCREKWMKWV